MYSAIFKKTGLCEVNTENVFFEMSSNFCEKRRFGIVSVFFSVNHVLGSRSPDNVSKSGLVKVN